MTSNQIKQLFVVGQTVTVTNHYITKEDHPCFGTRERVIERVSSSHLWFAGCGHVAWPKASQLRYDDGFVTFYGGGNGQFPADLFLSIDVRKAVRS